MSHVFKQRMMSNLKVYWLCTSMAGSYILGYENSNCEEKTNKIKIAKYIIGGPITVPMYIYNKW